MSRILITGGAGFIGQAAAEYLAGRGLAVRTFDMVPPKKSIAEHVNGSIMHSHELHRAAKGCDAVIHLAAVLGVKRTENDRMQCLDINITGTKNVLDACVSAGVKKVVYASSSEVYGEPLQTPISEAHPVAPKSVYGVAKLAGEEYVKAYRQLHGLNYTIVRFFNVYGPGQVVEFVLPKFIHAVMQDSQVTINGDGRQVRSFCYVADAARGVHLALSNDLANGNIFNIGNDQAAVSVLDLAHRVMEYVGKRPGVRFVDGGEADRKDGRDIIRRIPDITKARTILGYAPLVTLEEGIRRTIASGNIPESRFL